MGLNRGGGLIRGRGLIENDNFYMGAKSKSQVDLQDTIDTRYDINHNS